MRQQKLLPVVVILVLKLFVSVHAKPRPTFDKIADILDVLIDDASQYGRPRPRPYTPTGPLIQEGYHQGYDYSYGSGHGYGGGVGYVQPPPLQGGYGHYPHNPTQELRQTPVYYGNPHYPHRQPEPDYAYTESKDYGYGYGYGSSLKGRNTIDQAEIGLTGGYKARGY